LLTILNGENVPGGLQVKTRAGTWIDIETDPDTFVVNIGDLLMRWTNDRWVSNVHRVTTPPGNAAGAKRLSMAYFSHPNYDALIECVAPPGKAKYPPVLSGEYRDLKYRQTRLMETAKAARPEADRRNWSRGPTSCRVHLRRWAPWRLPRVAGISRRQG
jgi:isopenicillin N synthase-like dioxygenase